MTNAVTSTKRAGTNARMGRQLHQQGRLRWPAGALRAFCACLGVAACGTSRPSADLILTNGHVYTLSWADPSPGGRPAAGAPYDSVNGWHHDATAIAITGGRIVAVGSDSAMATWRGPSTRVFDLAGAAAFPGFVDAHTHVAELGTSLDRVNLTGVPTEAEAVDRIVARAAQVPKGEWIIGYGWDEGAWANHYPDKRLISEKVPDHPVMMRGLHGFAAWANALALEKAAITRDTPNPVGGEIRKDGSGEPTGLLINRAVPLLEQAVPAPNAAQRDAQLLRALHVMADAGYTGVHEAGVPTDVLASLQRLAARDSLPLRVYVMLDARDSALVRQWIARGPTRQGGMLVVRSIKAYYDGALGSRGAQLLEDYSDRPGHRGVSGSNYGFDRRLVADAMAAGFQVGIHAIGDAGNRASLDFIDSVLQAAPTARQLRHRIEHAQVVAPADQPRFATLGVIASMEPPHAVEDKTWAQDRLGPVRIKSAYAWRTLRLAGARLVFSSDLPGSGWSIFYGLHSAITRQDTTGAPAGGWYPDQRMTPEEAVRGYSSWGAYAGFDEDSAGVLAVGRRADVSVIDVDPMRLTDPAALMRGHVTLTVSRGRVTFQRQP